MAEAPQRDQILELFDGRQIDDHLIEKSNHRELYNGLERYKPAT
jgi:hypothetical protein